ncbi:MAG: ATP-binding protein [Ferroplasma sp.]|uniref:ATP-binding protein n=1 Tax=Ferroplasma sp. TaxID=2591003 RepID=UPI002815E41A|nr:ATP-binding protein [Ferroplasma sp.]WMT50721.1 MAG: ATP-binding protein [Ferroplasma sp.]
MEIFFDRERELEGLIADIEKYKSLIVLYGNRRVGKTELIKRVINKIGGIYLYVDNTKSSTLLLREFSQIIREYFNTSLFNPPDWDLFMKGLFELSRNRQTAVYFDEFQRFEDINKSVFTALQKNVDLYIDTSRLSIVCSGSSIGLIKKIFMDISLPLYKRATFIMHLKNFDFVTSYKYLRISIEDAIKMYSIFGGSPQFYKYFRLNSIKNVEEMIKNIFLSSTSAYVFEPRDFITEEFGRRSQTYFSILYAIATGNTRVSEIANMTDVKATSLQPYLFELRDILNLITYELPVTNKNNKIDKKGIYKLTDSYMEFWFGHFYPNMNQFELGNYRGVVNSLIQSVDAIAPHKFEEICRDLIIYMNNEKAGIMPFSIQKVGKWWGRNGYNSAGKDQEEIDILAINEEKKAIMFGECKWTGRPGDISIYEDLKRKAMSVQWNNKDRNEYFILFSRSGFTDKMKAMAEEDNVILFDLDRIESMLKK